LGSFEDVISFYLRRQIHLTSYHNQFNGLFMFFLLTGPEASSCQVSSSNAIFRENLSHRTVSNIVTSASANQYEYSQVRSTKCTRGRNTQKIVWGNSCSRFDDTLPSTVADRSVVGHPESLSLEGIKSARVWTCHLNLINKELKNMWISAYTLLVVVHKHKDNVYVIIFWIYGISESADFTLASCVGVRVSNIRAAKNKRDERCLSLVHNPQADFGIVP
jgi:hypothetical protein